MLPLSLRYLRYLCYIGLCKFLGTADSDSGQLRGSPEPIPSIPPWTVPQTATGLFPSAEKQCLGLCAGLSETFVLPSNHTLTASKLGGPQLPTALPMSDMLDVIKTQQMQQTQCLAKISGKMFFLLQPNSTAWVRLLVLLCRAQPAAERSALHYPSSP